MLLDGAKENLEAIDELIESASDNWTLDRMPVVDRSLLRLTTYEMRYVDDVPVSVSINEAVNLAKEFGGDDSPRFINGILGRIATQLEYEEAVGIGLTASRIVEEGIAAKEAESVEVQASSDSGTSSSDE